MKDVAGKVAFINGGVRMAVIAGGAILGMGCGALACAADTSYAESGSSRVAPPLLFEVAGFGAAAVGGRFRWADGGAMGTGSSVSLADHGAFALAADLLADEGTQYELFYSREATDLRGNAGVPRTRVTVEYIHLGGTVLLDDELISDRTWWADWELPDSLPASWRVPTRGFRRRWGWGYGGRSRGTSRSGSKGAGWCPL